MQSEVCSYMHMCITTFFVCLSMQSEVCKKLEEVDGDQEFYVDRWTRQQVTLYITHLKFNFILSNSNILNILDLSRSIKISPNHLFNNIYFTVQFLMYTICFDFQFVTLGLVFVDGRHYILL